jgi:hypothetical protein
MILKMLNIGYNEKFKLRNVNTDELSNIEYIITEDLTLCNPHSKCCGPDSLMIDLLTGKLEIVKIDNNYNKDKTFTEGERDPKYGGVITNVCKLPVGTKFFVRNGCWTGVIGQDDISKFVRIGDRSLKRFNDNDEEYLAIDPIKGIHYN